MSLDAILIALGLAAASGLPGLFMPRASRRAGQVANLLMCAAALLGLYGAFAGLFAAPGPTGAYFLHWQAADGAFGTGGQAALAVDPLSAFFLVPVFLLGGLGSIYGLGYWPRAAKSESARRLQLFWGLLVAGMALLLVARHALAFILGWETMAISAFFLICAEDLDAEGRKAGLVYLIATHIGSLALFGMFASWHLRTGSWAIEAIGAGATGTGALFLLALVGFGIKAGMMPLHSWLPGAHANAPSHVSAMMSGVVLKMGIYGLVRFLFLLPDPPAAWGLIVLALGAASGLLGVVFAIGQHDLKRLLAYHSIENIGIILMGLGLALLGRAAHRPEWLVLGLGACLLHVWNHSLFKSLLFLGAGSVLRGAGTRRIDRLGGLAKSMPWTAALFLVGAVAICGLPPLNGLVSEFLAYLGLFGTLGLPADSVSAAVAAVPALAMIGALALACFVKVYGIVFLGSPRRPEAGIAAESPPSMLVPMLILALACAFIGCAPALLGPLLDAAIAPLAALSGMAEPPRIAALAPLGTLGLVAACLLGAILCIVGLQALGARRARRELTWDCGYAAPTPRMQYTASSFARGIEAMFSWALRPREREPAIAGPFPEPSRLESHVGDVVLDRMIVPAAKRAELMFGWFRRFQRGLTQHYILYILIILVLMLGSLLPFGN